MIKAPFVIHPGAVFDIIAGFSQLLQAIIRQHDVRFGQDLSQDLFTVRQLEKGL